MKSVTVMLSDETYDLWEQFCKKENIPMSEYMGANLEELTPLLK